MEIFFITIVYIQVRNKDTYSKVNEKKIYDQTKFPFSRAFSEFQGLFPELDIRIS